MIEIEIATEEVLRAELDEFERRYGVDSFEHFELHRREERPEQVTPDESLVWAIAVARWREVTGRPGPD